MDINKSIPSEVHFKWNSFGWQWCMGSNATCHRYCRFNGEFHCDYNLRQYETAGKGHHFFFIKAFAVADLISALAILSNLNATTVSNDIIRHV